MSESVVPVTLDLRQEVRWALLPPDVVAQFTRLIGATVARAGLRGAFEVSVVITGDRQMQRVNRQFRGIDRTTDVLSFPQSGVPLLDLPPEQGWVARPFGDDAHQQPFMPNDLPPPTMPSAIAAGSPIDAALDGAGAFHLGDIIISAPTVERQAAAAGHSAWWECCFLLAHGTLHLLGYDDYYEPGYHAMVAQQDAVLADLGISR